MPGVNIKNHTQEPGQPGRKEENPMKKLIALTLIGVMLCSLPVCAATSPSAGTVTETKKEAAVVDGIPAAVVAAAAAEN